MRNPAGEMKHGPIALIDRSMPVVVIAPQDPWYEKMLSQVEQAKARGGVVIALATDGDERSASLADHVLWVPETPWMLSPVTMIIPLQLLAYQIAALHRVGCRPAAEPGGNQSQWSKELTMKHTRWILFASLTVYCSVEHVVLPTIHDDHHFTCPLMGGYTNCGKP